MASRYLDTDVFALLRIAELVERLARLDPEETNTAVKLVSEIRLQEARFGLTPMDRQRLHWQVGPPVEPETKPTKRKTTKPDPRELLGRDEMENE